jgi:hypothetical protein
MEKVYIVFDSCVINSGSNEPPFTEDDDVLGVFSTPEKADLYIEHLWDNIPGLQNQQHKFLRESPKVIVKGSSGAIYWLEYDVDDLLRGII